MPRFIATEATTLLDLGRWMELRPTIKTVRLRRPNGDPVTPTRGFRVIFEITNDSPCMGEPAESLIEALDSAIEHVEELLPL